MEVKKIIYMFFLAYLFSYETNHTVSMFNIPMANVKIEKKDTIYNNINALRPGSFLEYNLSNKTLNLKKIIQIFLKTQVIQAL